MDTINDGPLEILLTLRLQNHGVIFWVSIYVKISRDVKEGDSTNMVHLLAVVTRNLFLKVLNFSRIRPAAVESLHGIFSVRPLTGCGTPHEKTWPVFEASGQLKNYLTNFSSLLEFLRKK